MVRRPGLMRDLSRSDVVIDGPTERSKFADHRSMTMRVVADDDPDSDTESLWVEPTEVEGEYVLANVPFLVWRINRGDVVRPRIATTC